jgi:pimeloyl-ACP methyl ester carboxylesterase
VGAVSHRRTRREAARAIGGGRLARRLLNTREPRSASREEICAPMIAEVIRRSISVNGTQMSYLATGDDSAAPPVVLIHGSGMNARYWVAQLRGLGGVVIAPDLPGHGESDAPASTTLDADVDLVAALVAQVSEGPIVAVGHSLGGAIVLALAARHPAAVRGVVLLASCARLRGSEGLGRWLLPFVPGALRKELVFSAAKRLLFAPGAPTTAVRFGMHELRGCRPDTLARDVALARSMDMAAAARTLRVPTLILCGTRDELTPPALSRDLHALIAGSRLELIEGAGHMAHMEAPAAVNGEIDRFARSLTPVPAAEGRRRPAAFGPRASSPLRRLRRRLEALLGRG